jgi:hypothetical protein
VADVDTAASQRLGYQLSLIIGAKCANVAASKPEGGGGADGCCRLATAEKMTFGNARLTLSYGVGNAPGDDKDLVDGIGTDADDVERRCH